MSLFDGIGIDTALGMAIGASLVAYLWNSRGDSNGAVAGQTEVPRRRDFDAETLQRYNGIDGRLLYIAARLAKDEVLVFDVGAARSIYGKGGKFELCAGADASRCLALGRASKEDVRRAQELDDLSSDERDRLDQCVNELRTSFPIVGRLIYLREFTLAELANFDGSDGKPIYLAAGRDGKREVFDVTRGADFYGADGGYSMMAGRDASRALALMSLDVKDVDNTSLSDLSFADLNILDEWASRVFRLHFRAFSPLCVEWFESI